MKIDGIDPLLLNRIKEKTDRMEVQKTETAFSENRVKREHGYPQRKRDEMPDWLYGDKVSASLKQLNDRAENDGLPVYFGTRSEPGIWHVEIYDKPKHEIIRSIKTTRALDVLSRLHNLFGALLDERR